MTTLLEPSGVADPLADDGAVRDVRVLEVSDLPTPDQIQREISVDADIHGLVRRSRRQIADVIHGRDRRLLVVVGPCSIHDTAAGLAYARRLAPIAEAFSDRMVIAMRTYFEKPRTTVGWKGLINDPHLDGSHDIAHGLRTARQFLADVLDLGLPTATEFLEPTSPQYIADLVSWGAIGARTVESQIHRQLASGLSMPIGFKNGTDGSIGVAVDGCIAASNAQTFLGISGSGRAALVSTKGNPDTHVILRGASHGPNHAAEHVAEASERLARHGLDGCVVVDASHGNSGKSHLRQAEVAKGLARQVADGTVAGIMLESFLEAGNQGLDVTDRSRDLVFGQSVTDACMGWEATEDVLSRLADAAEHRLG